MAAFDLDELSPDNLAYRLMVNSTVHLYWRRELLEQATSWFAEHGYQLVRLKADEWRDESDMHSAFVAALDFPAYYGHNLNALNDCLRDVAAFRYGATPGAVGLLFVFVGYDQFARRCPGAAQAVLDIIASRARVAMLTGHRILALVQTDDPDLRFDPVGAASVVWNDAEWLNASRRR